MQRRHRVRKGTDTCSMGKITRYGHLYFNCDAQSTNAIGSRGSKGPLCIVKQQGVPGIVSGSLKKFPWWKGFNLNQSLNKGICTCDLYLKRMELGFFPSCLHPQTLTPFMYIKQSYLVGHFVIDFLSLLFVTVCPSVLQSVTLGDRPLTDDTAVLYLIS